MTPYSLVLADDHELFIDGLLLLFADQGTCKVVGVAKDGHEVGELLRSMQPDLLMIDINMPKLNGLETIRQLRPSYPALKMVVLTTYEEPHMIRKARELGADGYLPKNAGKEILFLCIRTVMNGEKFFPSIPENANEYSKLEHPIVLMYKLSRREWEILLLLKEQLSNKEIASKLFLSLYTVQTHRKNIMHKLKLRNPSALMKFILEQRI